MRRLRPFEAMSVDTDERGLALCDAAADPGRTVAAAAASQLVEQRHQNPGSAGPDRVADCNRAVKCLG